MGAPPPRRLWPFQMLACPCRICAGAHFCQWTTGMLAVSWCVHGAAIIDQPDPTRTLDDYDLDEGEAQLWSNEVEEKPGRFPNESDIKWLCNISHSNWWLYNEHGMFWLWDFCFVETPKISTTQNPHPSCVCPAPRQLYVSKATRTSNWVYRWTHSIEQMIPIRDPENTLLNLLNYTHSRNPFQYIEKPSGKNTPKNLFLGPEKIKHIVTYPKHFLPIIPPKSSSAGRRWVGPCPS
jgi:hypothetical protein